ncbi:MAG: Glu/Leu/Phe/Val dehydrogenase dimerization domain-containing protein [Bacteroidota bacterium]
MNDSSSVSIFEQMGSQSHELLLFCHDKATGLKAIIGVHNTLLGPAMGGLRMYPYHNEEAALQDVLRLSRAMTYKNALAGIHVGGGKAVIIGDPLVHKSEALLRRFGIFLNNLAGKYYVASDVGIKPTDLEYIKLETPYVVGVDQHLGGSGDSSPLTAYGVYLGMKAAVQHAEGHNSLSGKKIMVQGVGKVGSKLVKYLVKEGAEVSVYDVNQQAVNEVVQQFGVKAVEGQDVVNAEVDILSLNALGGVLNSESIPNLRCKMIVGGANNQLLNEEVDSLALRERGILFVPDFMVNAGGIINVSQELHGYHPEVAKRITKKIYDTTLQVLHFASTSDMTPLQAAMAQAEKRIKEVGNNRLYR